MNFEHDWSISGFLLFCPTWTLLNLVFSTSNGFIGNDDLSLQNQIGHLIAKSEGELQENGDWGAEKNCKHI
jgi:hypothetical protein